MHDEIKELFDMFKGGQYQYENDVVSFEMDDNFSSASILASINGEKASVWLNDDNYRAYYCSPESKSVEGSMLYIHPDIKLQIEGLIIAVKHHLEENGFDAVKYEDDLAKNYTHWIECKGRIREDARMKNYENMKRIYEDEPIEIFWK